MENVPGLLLYNQGEVAKEVIKLLRQSGYYAVPIIFLAADFGVPQLRRRLFFIANRSGSNVPLPHPTHGDNSLWDNFALPFEHLSRVGNKNVIDGVKPHVGFEDACGDLPSLEPGLGSLPPFLLVINRFFADARMTRAQGRDPATAGAAPTTYSDFKNLPGSLDNLLKISWPLV